MAVPPGTTTPITPVMTTADTADAGMAVTVAMVTAGIRTIDTA
jgi:hypothetical protein